MPNLLPVWITENCGKFFKGWDYQSTWPASWEICMQVKKKQLELDMEQQTGSKLGKEYVKAVYCHPVYSNYMKSTSCKMSGWMKHKLESGLLGKMSITSDMQMTPPLWQKAKRNYSASMQVKEESEKNRLKTQQSKNEDITSGPITSWQVDGDTWKQTLFSWTPITLHMVTIATKLKDACSLEEKLWQT